MQFARAFKGLACLTVLVGTAHSALAAPVAYNFTTDALTAGALPSSFPVSGPSSTAIFNALNGLSVSGSFLYDSDTPLTNVTNGPVVFNQWNYENSISGFSGSIGTFGFTAATGKMDVADEGFRVNIPPAPVNYDFLQLVSITDKGFALEGLPLITARLFWIEGNTTAANTPDFLTGNDLPASFPESSGRFALDFLDKDANGNTAITTAFFNGLTVKAAPLASVPEPGTLSLCFIGAALVAMTRRRREPLAIS
jgi:hypothetical protein